VLFSWSVGPRSEAQVLPALLGKDAPTAAPQSDLAESVQETLRPEGSAVHATEEVRQAATVSTLSGARVAHLRNGLTIIALRRPGPAFVSTLLGFHSAPSRDAPPGIWLAAQFGREYVNMWGPLESGILTRGLVGRDAVGEELSTYASRAGAVLDYLADRTSELKVHWPDEQFVRWASLEAASEKSLDGGARRRFLRALWPEETYGRPVAVVDVMERSEAEVKAWIARVERPENGALVIVGDVDPDLVVRSADRKLRGAWEAPPAGAAPLPAPAAVQPHPRTGPLPIQFNEAPRQRAATIGFGCFLPPARTPRDGVVGDLLGELLNQYLFERLRLSERKTYGSSVVHSQLWGGTSVLEGRFDIEDSSVVEGTSVIESCLKEGGQSILDPADIERVRWRVALARAAQFSSNDDVARVLFGVWKLGWSPATLDEVPGHVATVSGSELEAALRTCWASAVVSVTAAVALH
jgi:predicted Zn-dependent peptidase